VDIPPDSTARWDLLENWYTKTIHENDLRQAISMCNENRSLLQELVDLRQKGLVSGTDALQIIGTSMLMEKQEHNRLLKTLLSEYHQSSPFEKIRIFVEGSSLDNLQLYHIIESYDGLVVAEDSDWGNRSIEGQIEESATLLKAMTDFYFHQAPYPTKATIEERAAYCLQQVQKSQVDGVIFFIYQGDQPALWDYPEQKSALEANGVPSIFFFEQPYNLDESIDLRHQVRDFIQRIALIKERQN
jgi:benzoyl-CoA reductase/2-hydroxyglutaryl-CoA dehydratase subunit BcrC/BadD/HgdB